MSYKVGVAEVDITPPVGVGMGGLRCRRLSDSVRDPLLAKAVVFQDTGGTIALCECDLLWVSRETVLKARRMIEQRCGLAAEAVMIAATHTHTGPALSSPKIFPYFPATDYEATLPKLIADAVVKAWEARVLARIGVGTAEERRVAFNRRAAWRSQRRMPERDELMSVLKERERLSPVDVDSARLAQEQAAVDPTVGLLFVETAPEKPLVGILNYGTHVTTVGGPTFLSADFPAILAEKLRDTYGPEFHSIFVSGPAGDVNVFDSINPLGLQGFEMAVHVASVLAEDVLDLKQNLEWHEQGTVGCAARNLTVLRRQPTREQVEAAKDVIRCHTDCDDKFVWHAHETLALLELSQKCEIEVQVLQVGQTAFVGLPGEIFHEFGLEIKRRSPFPYTFVVELANGYCGYVPTEESFAQGGYEVILSGGSFLAPEAGQRMTDAAGELLICVGEGKTT